MKDKRSPLSEDLRRRAALVAVRSGELELARRFLENLPAPVFTDEGRHGPDWGPYQARAILTHAQIETQLCGSIAPRQYPGSPLQNAFQRSLEIRRRANWKRVLGQGAIARGSLERAQKPNHVY